MSPRNVVVCSMYANCAHKGHIEYIQRSKELAGEHGKLIVILNTDEQAILKHGYSFMPWDDRAAVIGGLRWVDEVVKSIDTDRTVCETLRMLCQRDEGERPTHFTNGGDQFNHTIPEREICEEYGIQLIDGLGDKVQSSRWIIAAAIEAAAAKRDSKSN